MAEQLKCVQRHQVVIVDRGGKRKIAQLRDLGKVSWGRDLSKASEAEIQVNGQACRAQADILEAINPRRHELAVYRDSERVWEGPITEVKYGKDQTIINAVDVLEYLDGTSLSKWWPGPDDGGPAVATTRLQQIIEHELTVPYTSRVISDGVPGVNRTFRRWEQLDPPANVLPHLEIRASTLPTALETLPLQASVFEHLNAIAALGLRYTVVGRRIVIWDGSETLGRLRKLAEKDLGELLNVYATSRNFTAIQHVIGQATDDPDDLEGVGTDGFEDPYYGVWTRIDTAQEISDEDDLELAVGGQARRLYQERRAMKLNLTIPGGGSLRLDDTFGIRDLVPGVDVPVSGTVNRRPIAARYILENVKVVEDAKGETVSGSLMTEAESE